MEPVVTETVDTESSEDGSAGGMRRHRGLVTVVAVLLVLALAVAIVPDLRTTAQTIAETAIVRAALLLEFGPRLGGTRVTDCSFGLTSDQDTIPGERLVLELRGDVTDADLCRALVALRSVRPEQDVLWVQARSTREDRYCEELNWYEEEGRLVRLRGDWDRSFLRIIDLGGSHACVFGSTLLSVVTGGVDRDRLKSYADDGEIAWKPYPQ